MQEPTSADLQCARRDFLIGLGIAGLALFLAACRRVSPGATPTPEGRRPLPGARSSPGGGGPAPGTGRPR